MNSITKNIASFYKWLKGVLMLMPLDIVLLVVVLCLFIIAFIVSLTSTKGPFALKNLKQYLGNLQLRLDQTTIIDAEVERSGIEIKFNDVKASCHKHVITGDTDLEHLLSHVYGQLCTLTNSHADETKTSWIKLRAVTQGFGELYYIDFGR